MTDLTNTTWIFNDYIDTPPIASLSFNITFTSNNTSFIKLSSNGVRLNYWETEDSNIRAYDTNAEVWYNDNYKTIAITGGTDTTNSTLISWLEANATLQDSGGSDTSNSNGKIGNLSIIKKHFGDLEIIKEVLNGATVYSNGEIPTPPTPTYPSKSDIITMNIDGTSRRYRVLKNVSGTTYEVLCLESIGTSQWNTSANYYYFGSTLDTFYTNYYNSLPTASKSAIVSKSLTQYAYTKTSSGNYDTNRATTVTTTKTIVATSTRYMYALGLDDIDEYFNYNFSQSDLTSFLNKEFYLKDKTTDNYLLRFYYYTIATTNYNQNLFNCYPTFQIDLSKITFTINS